MRFFSKSNRKVERIARTILYRPLDSEAYSAPIYNALTNLPPFRPVVVNLMSIFDKDDAGAAKIASLVEADPALASEVLALANSPLFGLSQSVTSLTQGITVLGLERVKALATVIAMRTMTQCAPRTSALRRSWRHSIACALIARELAPAFNVEREQAYTAGILHDVGRFGMLATHCEKYVQLCCLMHNSPAEILANEAAWFEVNHCQAGLFLVASWRLPEMFHGAVSLHHRRDGGDGMNSLLQVACLMADSIEMDAIRYKLPKPEAVMTLLSDETREMMRPKLAGIESAVLDSIKAFDC